MLKSYFSYRGYQGVDLVDDKLVLQKVGSPAPIFRSRSKPVGTVELGKHEIYEIYFSSRGFGWQSRGLHIVTKSRTYVAASDHCLSLDFQEIVMRWLGVAGLQRIRRNSLVRKLSGLLILIFRFWFWIFRFWLWIFGPSDGLRSEFFRCLFYF